MKKKNQICKQDPVCWRSNTWNSTRGPWGYFELQEGAKTGPKMGKNRHILEKKIKKIEINKNQGPFFFWFQAQMIKFGVKVQMDTFDGHLGTEGGQK